MILKINGEIWTDMDGNPHTFEKATQTETTYTLDGRTYMKTEGYVYELIGGEWTKPDPKPEEVMRADIDYLLMMIGE